MMNVDFSDLPMTTTTPPDSQNELQPVEPSLLLSEPDPRAKMQRRRVEFWQISWLICLSSLLISLYSVFLSQRLAPAASQTDLDRAALVLAKELGTLCVKHNRFGNVGLLHFEDENQKQMGLNYLQATLRLDGMLAQHLGLDAMKELVAADARDANFITSNLARIERELANPKAPPHLLGRDSFAELVRKVFAHTGAESRIRSLKITLGGLKNSSIGTNTPVPDLEENVCYRDGKNYRSHVKVPIWENLNYEFYEQSSQASLIPASQFQDLPEDVVASAVLIDAEFDVADRGRPMRLQKMQSCAVIGVPHYVASNSAFMFSFPQGYLSSFSCLNDIFAPSKFLGEKGEWLQAVGAEVPGPGHLSPPYDGTLKKEPQLAAVSLFYHFIFNLGPDLIMDNLRTLLQQPISALAMHADEKISDAEKMNSGLYKPTGAAAFALSKQSQSGAEGQKILAYAFSSKKFGELMASSAFPLVVDSDGSPRLPQHSEFDEGLLKEFLESLHQTNIAGIETMQIANTVVQRMQNSIEQHNKRLASLNEEVGSLKRSIDSLADKIDPNRDQKLNQLSEQINSLIEEQQKIDVAKGKNKKIQDRANLARKNGREAARSSYEIASHMSAFVSKGVRRVTAPIKGFILGKHVVFNPHLVPVEEDGLYDLVDTVPGAVSEDNESHQSWESDQFEVIQMAEPSMSVEGKPFVEFWQTVSEQTVNRPLYVILGSADLRKKKGASLYLSRSTPFGNGAIGKSELCYFAAQCIESGKTAKARWSVLMRDLVYSNLDKSGKPLQSDHPRWCTELGMSDDVCPGLAAEIQIRCPVPVLSRPLSSLQLQDPDGGPPVTLYPPLPADLL